MKSRQAGFAAARDLCAADEEDRVRPRFSFHSNQKHRQREETVTSGCSAGAKVQLKSYIYIFIYMELGRQTHTHADELKFREGGKKSTQICAELAVTLGLQRDNVLVEAENFSDSCTLNFFNVLSESDPST